MLVSASGVLLDLLQELEQATLPHRDRAQRGFNLLWDRYSYDYGRASAGNPDAEVRLECELRGTTDPPIPATLPEVSSRVGLDLNPLDVNREEDNPVAQGFDWPEHAERRRTLEKVVEVARRNPVKMVRGDATETLPRALEESSDSFVICIFSTFVLNQFQPMKRKALFTMLSESSSSRPLNVINASYVRGDDPELMMMAFNERRRLDELVAYVDPHGRWLEWLLKSGHSRGSQR